MDWKKMVEVLGTQVAERLQGLVEGAEEDLRSYGLAIAKDLIVAVRTGNKTKLLKELYDQAQLLAEVHRIRMSNEANDVLNTVLMVSFKILEVAV